MIDADAKRFLLVSGDFVRTGGMDMANYAFASFLARAGYEVHVVAHRVDSALLSASKVTWHRAPRPRRSTILGEPFLRTLGRSVARRLGGREGGTRMIVNGGNCPLPDVNWVHYVHAATNPMTGAGLFQAAKSRYAYARFLRSEATALRRARLIIANSERTKQDIIRCYGIDSSLIRTVYCGTDPSRFYLADEKERKALRKQLGFSPDKYLVVFIGALGDRRKGFSTLYEAWKLLGTEISARTELLVIGSGVELPLWKKRSVELSPAGCIRFLGFRSDVPAILRAADALVAPTRYEPFGLAVLEALCCGLPALVSHDAGVAERYPRELNELLLANPSNLAEVAEKLRSLIARNDCWRDTVQPIANALRAYTWEDMSQAMYQIIRRN
jgi:glycosyltransferase involved in cell wall biosynthesis